MLRVPTTVVVSDFAVAVVIDTIIKATVTGVVEHSIRCELKLPDR